MESFTRTLAVRFINQEDSHSLMRRGKQIFDIFIKNPVRQTQSCARQRSKKVAKVVSALG